MRKILDFSRNFISGSHTTRNFSGFIHPHFQQHLLSLARKCKSILHMEGWLNIQLWTTMRLIVFIRTRSCSVLKWVETFYKSEEILTCFYSWKTWSSSKILQSHCYHLLEFESSLREFGRENEIIEEGFGEGSEVPLQRCSNCYEFEKSNLIRLGDKVLCINCVSRVATKQIRSGNIPIHYQVNIFSRKFWFNPSRGLNWRFSYYLAEKNLYQQRLTHL